MGYAYVNRHTRQQVGIFLLGVVPGVDRVVQTMAFSGKLVVFLVLCCCSLLVSGKETMSITMKMNPATVEVSAVGGSSRCVKSYASMTPVGERLLLHGRNSAYTNQLHW